MYDRAGLWNAPRWELGERKRRFILVLMSEFTLYQPIFGILKEAFAFSISGKALSGQSFDTGVQRMYTEQTAYNNAVLCNMQCLVPRQTIYQISFLQVKVIANICFHFSAHSDDNPFIAVQCEYSYCQEMEVKHFLLLHLLVISGELATISMNKMMLKGFLF